MDEARGRLRALIVRLGEEAGSGVRDVRSLVAPFVEVCLAVRERVRSAGRYEDADAIRDALIERGVEIRDSGGETEWYLRSASGD
jgi:cysteinyl-tRNA synthetase